MSKYLLINELCESRIFRSKQAMDKYSVLQANTMLYSILLSTIALALTPKTNAWAKKYASKSAAFGNFKFFRPTGTDLYVLTHMAIFVNETVGPPAAASLLRLYKGLGKGDIDSNYAEQTLLRLERGLRIKDMRLKNARRALTHWSNTSEDDQKNTITNLYRSVRSTAKLAEVLPYLQSATAGEAGHFGRSGLGNYAAAVAAAGLAGIALGYNYDTGKRWGVLKNCAEFDGEKLLTEDRPTQLFTLVQNLNHHPDIDKIIGVNYLADGVSAFVRTTDGNAYELEIRPAPFAKGHDIKRGVTEAVEKLACLKCDEVSTKAAWQKNSNFCPKCKNSNQGVTESEENPKCDDCYDTGWTTEKVYDDVVKVPCQYCSAERRVEVVEVKEGCWEWEIMRVVINEGEARHDVAKTGNDAAKIARTSKQAAEIFSNADKGGDGCERDESVQDHLEHIRAMYGVEIVDDFLDVLELSNAEADTDKQQSLFSKDNR